MNFTYSGSISARLLISLLLVFACSKVARAGDFSIETANASFNQTSLSVSAKFDLNLGETIDEALQNGISINLVTALDLYARRRYVWDVRIAQWAFVHQISYHSLTRNYILSRPPATETATFSSLPDLLDQIETFSFQSDILGDTMPQSKSGYKLQLRIALDKSALPTPLRVMTYVSPAWKLKSEVHEWFVDG